MLAERLLSSSLWASALSTLNLRIDLSRFFRLATHGDRRKHRHVTEIECKARWKKIDEDIRKLKIDRALAPPKDRLICIVFRAGYLLDHHQLSYYESLKKTLNNSLLYGIIELGGDRQIWSGRQSVEVNVEPAAVQRSYLSEARSKGPGYSQKVKMGGKT